MKRKPVQLQTYAVIARAVEEGIRYGMTRAYKHSARPPSQAEQDRVGDAIADAVMLALSEVIVFPEP